MGVRPITLSGAAVRLQSKCRVLLLVLVMTVLKAGGPVYAQGISVNVATSQQLLQALALENVTVIQLLNDISLDIAVWQAGPVVNISRYRCEQGEHTCLLFSA